MAKVRTTKPAAKANPVITQAHPTGGVNYPWIPTPRGPAPYERGSGFPFVAQPTPQPVKPATHRQDLIVGGIAKLG